MDDPFLYFGSLSLQERQYQIANFIGLALNPAHDREIAHNAMTDPLPFADSSIRKIQSQDVFEHIPFTRVGFVLDEVYRVLKPGGVFRLSVPDYRSPVLKKRSIYDHRGKVVGDLMMGASAYYDPASAQARVRFAAGGDSHIWFPRYETVLHLIVHSNIRHCAIRFWQAWLDDDNHICEPVPDDEMFVWRAFPHDPRSQGRPISIIVDFVK
ncbi:MAG: methyltransferase domain-containing protein [Alphaproteobacteria bacterium]|nr:methyltransferase domain-containing protein [Alphaproteobacteria bacterium]